MDDCGKTMGRNINETKSKKQAKLFKDNIYGEISFQRFVRSFVPFRSELLMLAIFQMTIQHKTETKPKQNNCNLRTRHCARSNTSIFRSTENCKR